MNFVRYANRDHLREKGRACQRSAGLESGGGSWYH